MSTVIVVSVSVMSGSETERLCLTVESQLPGVPTSEPCSIDGTSLAWAPQRMTSSQD